MKTAASVKLLLRFVPPKSEIVRRITDFLMEQGGMVILMAEAFYWAVKPPFRFKEFVEQLEFIGNKSLFIILLTATFTGGVFALQVYNGFKIINAEALVSPTTGIALLRELGPVLTGLIVTGRAGAAMAAQLGTMRVTEQIDALYVLAINPKQYLVTPRILAALIAVPALTGIFDLVGNVAGYLVGTMVLGIDAALYITQFDWIIDWYDIWHGLIKSVIFGLVLATVGCYQGFFTQGGAAGVGRATNRAVVVSSVLILMLDFVMTALLPTGYQAL